MHRGKKQIACFYIVNILLRKLRCCLPTSQCVDILKQMYDKVRVLNHIDKPLRMDLLLSLQSIVNSCVEENSISEVSLVIV